MKVALLSILTALLLTPAAMADVFITSDGTGTYVGGLSNLSPNGAYVGGTPTITADGFYVDGTAKKKYKNKKWHQFKVAKSSKPSSPLKIKSK